MMDIQKEFDELTPENQELVKKVISALSVAQRNEKLAKAREDLLTAHALLDYAEAQRSRGLITKEDYDSVKKTLEDSKDRAMQALRTEQEKEKPKPDMGR